MNTASYITQRDYYLSAALGGTATVIGIEPAGEATNVILDRTIFVCQGGGQRCDLGFIAEIPVLHVEADENDPGIIRHRVHATDAFHVGDVVPIRIDPERRRRNSRLHSGGHLLAGVVPQLLPGAKARSGHHWPDEARVEFNYDGQVGPDVAKDIEATAMRLVAADWSVRISIADDGTRFVQIGEFPLMRCGGTHVGRLADLGAIVVRNVKLKKGLLRVGYDVVDRANSWSA